MAVFDDRSKIDGIFGAALGPVSKARPLPPLAEIMKALSERALAQGYTDLRLDQKTMGWAYHKPDQAVGDDGRLYVKVAKS